MALIKNLHLLFLSLFLSTSCAKISYLYNQGKGQFQLLYQGRLNHKVLNDPRISSKDKDKIKKIIKYKKWFYSYWGDKESNIYNKTTFLKDKAVSYLLIASPYDHIEAKKECFPFMGCFPYLGYFKREDALKRAKELEDDDWITFIRPVYAYSTLGKLNDRILSSFFHYDDQDLAELIFHELFHTLFFIKNEVKLNENLANFFATQMRALYFKEKPFIKKHELLHESMLTQIKKLNEIYSQENNLTKSKAKNILNRFIEKQFYPSLLQHCKQYKIHPCYPLRQKNWNNASLAAFLTYESEEEKIRNLYQQLKKEKNLSIKEFFFYIKDQYKNYRNKKKAPSFGEYLFKKP